MIATAKAFAGTAIKADSIEVRWPNGLVERFANVEGNRLVKIREGSGINK